MVPSEDAKITFFSVSDIGLIASVLVMGFVSRQKFQPSGEGQTHCLTTDRTSPALQPTSTCAKPTPTCV
jgi:hypothetical protein